MTPPPRPRTRPSRSWLARPRRAARIGLQPTLSRFENRITAKDPRRLSDRWLDLYLKTHPGPRKVIILDMDATATPPTGSSNSASSTVITQSTCMTAWSLTGAPAYPWRQCCAPGTPTLPAT